MADIQIKFKREKSFHGRNGTGKQSAITLLELPNNVCIWPVTSRGNLGNCEIQIDKDPEVLRQIAAFLFMLAEKCEQGSDEPKAD